MTESAFPYGGIWTSRYVLDAKSALVRPMSVEVFESEGRRVAIALRHDNELMIPARQFVVFKPEQAIRLARVIEELTGGLVLTPKARLA
jgi:hypothetical protein